VNRNVESTGQLYEVVNPLGRTASRTRSLARRLDTLEGKTIGELWNGMFYGDTMFPMIRELLAKKYPGINFVPYSVFGSTHSATEARDIAALPGKLAFHGCDAVISGNGC
jgi:hypothetical protein